MGQNEFPNKLGFQTACVSKQEHSFVVFAERYIQLHGGSMRLHLLRSVPRKPWEESRSTHLARLKRVTRSVNAAYDVAGVCSGFLKRVEELRARGGGKLGK